MPTLTLSSADRRALRGRAHHLDPIVVIGQKGLTSAVLHEIDNALAAHELIKVRVVSDERDTRAAMLRQICETLSCANVQHLGKLLVLFRPGKEPETPHKGKPEIERPRHTDFPKTPPRVRKSADTRPARAPAPTRRRAALDEDPWSDLPLRVRQRIDPNFNANAERGTARRTRAEPGTSSGTKPASTKSGSASGTVVRPRKPGARPAAGASGRGAGGRTPTPGVGGTKNPPKQRVRSKTRSALPAPACTPRLSPRATQKKGGPAARQPAGQSRRRLRKA